MNCVASATITQHPILPINSGPNLLNCCAQVLRPIYATGCFIWWVVVSEPLSHPQGVEENVAGSHYEL